MSAVVVCSLARLPDVVAANRPSHIVSLLSPDGHPGPDAATLAGRRHLHIGINDITEPLEGQVLATADHVAGLIDFIESWDRKDTMVVHCYAGISRSSAAAFIALAMVRPDVAEAVHAQRLRAASPTATPNAHIVALADTLLGRRGRMITAVETIGRGVTAFEGTPFSLPLEP